MSNEEKIKILRDKITDLTSEIDSSRLKLELLRSELDALEKSIGIREPLQTNGSKQNVFTRPSLSQAPAAGQPWLEHFIGLRLIHLVGIIVLVTGLSIGVKYAVDEQLISEAMRILLAYSAGALLFLFSARLKKKYRLFSAILFSGSMASLYFTTYAASVYYQFIPGIVAFIMMATLTAYTAVMAINYDSKEIGIIGMIGAYAIPFLVSANNEQVGLFFSYILLINLGVVFISFKRSWRLMEQLAMLITWSLFTAWAFFQFNDGEEFVAAVFMIFFYILFLVVPVAFNTRRHTKPGLADSWHLVVNNIALYIAAVLVFSDRAVGFDVSLVTGIMFIVTALVAWTSSWLFSRERQLQRILILQSIFFLLLYISLQWDGLVVTLLWLTVSIFLFGWGIYKKMSWPRLASVFLIGITLAKLLLLDSGRFTTVQKITSYLLIGILLLLFSWYYQKYGLYFKSGTEETDRLQK